MTQYKVVWEIEVEADTPLEAAKQAYAIQRDYNSTATYFKVVDSDDEYVAEFDFDEL